MPQARQPWASVTQVLSLPATHSVTPLAAHWLLHVPQVAASWQKPPGQAVAALQLKQPWTSATQVSSWPDAHEVFPALGQVLLQAPQLVALWQKPPGQAVAAAQLPVLSQTWTPPPEHCIAPGEQTPVHAPLTHAWLVHGLALPN